MRMNHLSFQFFTKWPEKRRVRGKLTRGREKKNKKRRVGFPVFTTSLSNDKLGEKMEKKKSTRSNFTEMA